MEAIIMLIFLSLIAIVGVIYFEVQDRKEAKCAKLAQQEPINVPDTLEEIAKEMKKITKKLTNISQKLQEVAPN